MASSSFRINIVSNKDNINLIHEILITGIDIPQDLQFDFQNNIYQPKDSIIYFRLQGINNYQKEPNEVKNSICWFIIETTDIKIPNKEFALISDIRKSMPVVLILYDSSNIKIEKNSLGKNVKSEIMHSIDISQALSNVISRTFKLSGNIKMATNVLFLFKKIPNINNDIKLKSLIAKLNKEKRNINVVITGKTGVGKSTLINKILFGDNSKNIQDQAPAEPGKPCTQIIKAYTFKDKPFKLYDTPGFELDKYPKIKEDVMSIIIRNLSNKKEKIDILWYAVNDYGNRIEDYEIALIKEITVYVPVIIVITQAKSKRHGELEGAIEKCFDHLITLTDLQNESENLDSPIKQKIALHKLRALPNPRDEGDDDPSYGIAEFIHLNQFFIDEQAKFSLNEAQMADLDLKTKSAKTRIAWDTGFGFFFLKSTTFQIYLYKRIAKYMEITITEDVAKDCYNFYINSSIPLTEFRRGFYTLADTLKDLIQNGIEIISSDLIRTYKQKMNILIEKDKEKKS